ncbi:MAG: ABC transporter ATP-binding protein, partial [Clostridia bacterium]
MKMHCIRRLLSYIRPYSGYLVLALISALASVAATLYVPVLIGRTVDVLVYGFSPAFWQLIAMLIGAIAIAALCTWALSFFTNVLTYKAVCDLRCALFEKIWSLPLSFVDRNAHGDIISRLVNDIDQVSDGLLQGFTQLFTGVITIIGTLVFMLMADKWITLLVVLMTPLSLFVAAFIAKKSFRHFRAQSKTQGELAGFIEEMVTNESLIKSFAREERCEAEFDEINARLYVSGQKSQFAASLSNPSTRF